MWNRASPVPSSSTSLSHGVSSQQTEYRTLWPAIRALIRDEGMGSFLRGVGPRMLKAAPACAIMISVYELFKTYMK
jgi:solute carrier family 25 protein 39/40